MRSDGKDSGTDGVGEDVGVPPVNDLYNYVENMLENRQRRRTILERDVTFSYVNSLRYFGLEQ